MASSSLLEVSTPSPGNPEGERGLSHLAFTRLLEWLDDGVDSRGERYLEMRRRLVCYFDRRDRRCADELADETLNRVGRTLANDGAIVTKPQARYCYVVAKFVLLENIRSERSRLRIHDSRHSVIGWDERGATLIAQNAAADHEELVDLLDRHLQELSADQRALIVEYYRDEGGQKIARRRALAERLGISMNALGLRAARIREAVRAAMAD
jgi:hypothetical protein